MMAQFLAVDAVVLGQIRGECGGLIDETITPGFELPKFESGLWRAP
jgi:hypothetical protein